MLEIASYPVISTGSAAAITTLAVTVAIVSTASTYPAGNAPIVPVNTQVPSVIAYVGVESSDQVTGTVTSVPVIVTVAGRAAFANSTVAQVAAPSFPPSMLEIASYPVISTSGAVAGNTAVTTPEPAAFVAVAPATVKKLAATPVKVQPAFGVIVMVAA